VLHMDDRSETVKLQIDILDRINNCEEFLIYQVGRIIMEMTRMTERGKAQTA
jgi:hypothetical protein